MQPYSIPVEPVSFSEEIKKSRFITYLAPAPDVAAAKTFVQEIKKAHPAARHHCWAFIAGWPEDSRALGFSDDGEPSGTAGKPILAQLTGSGLGEIVAVVVRYYGGVLLGTGGLVRAYGGGVQQALKLLTVRLKTPTVEYSLNCDYHQLKLVEAAVEQSGGQIIQTIYTERIDMTLALPVGETDAVIKKLRDISKGSLLLSPIK